MPGAWITPGGDLIDVPDDVFHEDILDRFGLELSAALRKGWIRIRGDVKPEFNRPGGWDFEVWDARERRTLELMEDFIREYPPTTDRVSGITTHRPGTKPLYIIVTWEDIEEAGFKNAVLSGIRIEQARSSRLSGKKTRQSKDR